MGLFDSIQSVVQGVVTRVYGSVAIWTPLNGSGSYDIEVLFNEPTAKEKVGSNDYIIERPRIEYLEEQFPGLFDLIQAKSPEIISINSIDYYAFHIEKKFDGTTVVLYLERK